MDRNSLVKEIADAMREAHPNLSWDNKYIELADVALRVIETPADYRSEITNVCTCGQNGFPENSIHSNHPHLKGCPHYATS